MTESKKIIRIGVLAPPGFTDTAYASFVDLIRFVNLIFEKRKMQQIVEFSTISLSKHYVTSKSGLKLKVDYQVIDKIPKFSNLVVLGFWVNSITELDTYLQKIDQSTLRFFLKKNIKENISIYSACTGVPLIASLGLLNGQTAVIATWLKAYAQMKFPRVIFSDSQIITRSENKITAGPVLSHINLYFQLIDDLFGKEIVSYCSHFLSFQPRSHEKLYTPFRFSYSQDNFIKKVQAWILTNIHRQFSMREVAESMGLGERTLARRILKSIDMTPYELVNALRLDRAIDLIETTDLSIEEISFKVGYQTSSSLNKLIKQHTNLKPSSFRSRR